MKIKRYKLKENVTKDSLIALGFKNGGYWVSKDAELYLMKHLDIGWGLSFNIVIPEEIKEWDDFEHVLVVDEVYGQPYTPFYGDNFGKDITDFPFLEQVIREYNKFMDGLGIFEEIIKE